MLDNLYENIGGKIKGLAKWAFVVEAIGAVITGFVLMCADSTLILYGLLTIFFGPIVAFVSTWILYGFGELIDNTSGNAQKNTMVEIKSEEQVEPDSNKIPQEQQDIPETTDTSNIDLQSLPLEKVWEFEVSQKSTEELQKICSQRFEWSKEYRAVCKKELQNRRK